jgi:uncharacterized protein YraI
MATLLAAATSELNLRESASDAAPIRAVIPPGGQLEVLGNCGVWLYARFGEQVGFAHCEFTQPVPPIDGETKWATTVSAAELNVRQGPAPDMPLVGVLLNGQPADVLAYQGVWLLVLYQGQAGFINGAYTLSVSETGGAPAPASTTPLVGVAIRERMSPEEIRAARAQIRQEPDERLRGDRYEALQAGVLYSSQRDNQASAAGIRIETRSGAMCNLTSLAMALSYLGIPNPNPALQYEDALEELRVARGLPARTLADGWGGVARALGAQPRMIGTAVTAGRDWWEANVRPVLRQDAAVIFSIGGHIVRLQAVTEQGLIVDDPYGRCRLLPGEERQWRYERVNGYDTPGEMAGADSLWLWDDVARHTMRWIAAISPASGVLGPAPDLGDFEDDGVVMESVG